MSSGSMFSLPDLSAIVRHDPEDRLVLDRWRRATMIVRCALHPGSPNQILVYLGLGERLLRDGIGKPLPMYFRMFDTLVRTAVDESLPLDWRHLCAEGLVRPASRLRTLLGGRDPRSVQALEARIEQVRSSLSTPGPQARPGLFDQAG